MIKPFDADQITLSNWEGVLTVIKKAIPVHAIQINFSEGFTVTSKEGVVSGKPGDYLMFGVEGEKYIISKGIFERTYTIIGGGVDKQSEDYYEKLTGVPPEEQTWEKQSGFGKYKKGEENAA